MIERFRSQGHSIGSEFPNTESESNLLALYSNLSSVATVAPSRTQADVLITFCLSSIGWHLSVLHAPTFMEEYVKFWALAPHSFDRTPPAWLSLFFALLAVGAAMLPLEQQILLGLSPGTS